VGDLAAIRGFQSCGDGGGLTLSLSRPSAASAGIPFGIALDLHAAWMIPSNSGSVAQVLVSSALTI
jgi:hypothetical protein